MWFPIWDSLINRMQKNKSWHEFGEIYAVALDLPGHGDSEPFKPPLQIREFGSSILYVLDKFLSETKISFDNIVGVGHSIGGTSLLCAELMKGNTFQSMYLVEPILVPDLESDGSSDGDNPISRMTLKRKSNFPSIESAADNWKKKKTFSSWKPEALSLYAKYGLRKTFQGNFELKCAPELEAAVFRVRRGDVVNSLGKITCPVTWINSLGDNGHVPAEMAVNIFRALGNGRSIILLPRCTHFAPMEAPELISEYLEQHLVSSKKIGKSNL